MECNQHIRKEYGAQKWRDSNTNRGDLSAEVIKLGGSLVDGVKQPVCFLIEEFAFFCQGHMIFGAREQTDRKFFFQFTDCIRYGRLCHVKFLGSLCDAVVTADGTKVF